MRGLIKYIMTLRSTFVMLFLIVMFALSGFFISVLDVEAQIEDHTEDALIMPAQYYGGGYGGCIDPVTGYPCY
jgi:hypothetical protein